VQSYRKEFDFKKNSLRDYRDFRGFKDLKGLRGKSKISSKLDFDFLSPCTIFK
jgi:hypothetical protein